MSDRQCTDTRIGELLHAYELGLLEEGEKQQFEVHLLGCEYCLAQIEKRHAHVLALRNDREIQEAVAARCRELSGARHWPATIWSIFWSRTTVRFRPIYAAAAAALLLTCGFAVTRFFSEGDIAQLQVVTLIPNRSVSDASFVRSLERDGLLSVVIENAVPGERFDAVVSDSGGRIVGRSTSFIAADSVFVTHLLFPAREMKPGTYVLQVMPQSGAAAADTIRYGFRVVDAK